jgi:hypothetical protein
MTAPSTGRMRVRRGTRQRRPGVTAHEDVLVGADETVNLLARQPVGLFEQMEHIVRGQAAIDSRAP